MSGMQWELRFHRTLHAQADADVFVVSHDTTRFTLIIPAEYSKKLAKHVVTALNDVAHGGEWVPQSELLAIKAMFHGPWYPSSSGVKCLQLSDDEARRIKNFVFKTAAEKSSIEGQYDNLMEDFKKVVRRNDVLEQEILRARGAFSQEPRTDTVADLFEEVPGDTAQIEMPDMACRKQIVGDRP